MIKQEDIEDIAYQLAEWKDDFSVTSGVVTAVYHNVNGEIDVEDTFDDDVLEDIENQLLTLSANDDVRKMWVYNGQLVYVYGRNKWYMDDESPVNDYTQFLFTKSELLDSPFDIDKLEPIIPNEELVKYNHEHMENLKTF